MPKIILCRGIQGSGKSTWAKAWVAENSKQRVRFNNDDMRNMFGPYGFDQETLVKFAKQTLIEKAMDLGHDIVIDNMNLNPKETQFFKDLTMEYNRMNSLKEPYELEYKDFFIPVEECIERDSRRPNPIGATIIKQTWNRYRTMICTLENQRVYNRMKKSSNTNKAVIFDMDATLCFNLSGRPYFGAGAAEGMLLDVPNLPVINMLKAYKNAGYTIIILTGREGTNEILEATKQWLKDYEIPYDKLFTRAAGDYRKGQVFKLEIVNSLSKEYNIELIVDDSTKIVEYLREHGYTVLQPNEGKF